MASGLAADCSGVATSDSRPVSLRIISGERSVTLTVSLIDTVGHLRARVQAASELEPAGRAARLIFAGRMLREDSESLGSVGFKDGAVAHVVFSAQPAAPAPAAPAAVRAAAAAGPAGSPAAPADVAVAIAPGEVDGGALSGFDRLRLLGLSSEDIEILRSQFLEDVRRDFGGMQAMPGESEESRLHRMEEAWLRSQPDDSDFVLNLRPLLLARSGDAPWAASAEGRAFFVAQQQRGGWPSPAALDARIAAAGGRPLYDAPRGEGGDEEQRSGAVTRAEGTWGAFVAGVACGWLLGLVALLWAVMPSSSRKFRMGIFAGMAVSLTITLVSPLSSAASSSAEDADSSASGGASGGTAGGGSAQGAPGGWSGPGSGWQPINVDSLGSGR